MRKIAKKKCFVEGKMNLNIIHIKFFSNFNSINFRKRTLPIRIKQKI